MTVNKELLPVKGHYLAMFAATAPMLPFLPLFGIQLGLQSGITLVYSILPFVAVLVKMATGALADARRIHKKVLLVLLLITTTALFGLYFTPTVPPAPLTPAPTQLDCTPAGSFLRHNKTQSKCKDEYLELVANGDNATCQIVCEDHDNISVVQVCAAWGGECVASLSVSVLLDLSAIDVVKNETFIPIKSVGPNGTAPLCPTTLRFPTCLTTCQTSKETHLHYLGTTAAPLDLSQLMIYPQFWMFLCLMLLAWPCFAGAVTLSDTLCFAALGKYGGEYGKQRVWGAVGWGVVVVITGGLIDAFSPANSSIKNYGPAFILTLVLFVLDLFIVAKWFKESSQRPAPPCTPSLPHPRAPHPLTVLTEPRVALFVGSCVVVGVSTGALWTYQLILVEQVAKAWQCDFHWLKLLDGLIVGMQCFGGEIPFFMVAGAFLKRLGHVKCMAIVLATFGLRFVFYGVLTNPWMFLPVEMLQGLTFGLFYTTMACYASAVAPPGGEALLQGVVGGAFEGLGVAIGGSVGGAVVFKYGGQTLFLYLGIFNLCFSVLFMAANYAIQRLRPKTAYTPQYPVDSSEPLNVENVSYLGVEN